MTTAFDLMVRGMRQSAPPASSYTPPGVDSNNSARLVLTEAIPDTLHFMAQFNYVQNVDDRGALLSYENIAATDGILADNATSDGFCKPIVNIPIDGVTDINVTTLPSYTIGDRINMVITGTIAAGTASVRVVIWDETSGTASVAHTEDKAGGATTFEFSTRYGINGAFFSSGGGQRPIDIINYRSAWWNLASAPPDITDSGVQDNLLQAANGYIVDPLVTNAAYGTPIFDVRGDAATLNAGTNQGTGAAFTKGGSDFTDV